MKALLLSAGLGTRLKPITDNLPKVMVPINKKPCIAYHIENLRNQGIEEMAINIHYLPEKIRDYFGNGEKFGVKINYSFEPKLLGTAGALNNFREYFNDTFIVVYADVVANFNLEDALAVHKKSKGMATIALDRARPFEGKGLAIKKQDKIIKFIEKPSQAIADAYINSGFYIANHSILDLIPKGFSDFGKHILPSLAKRGELYAYEHKGYIFDIGTITDLKKAEEFLSRENIN